MHQTNMYQQIGIILIQRVEPGLDMIRRYYVKYGAAHFEEC